MTRYRTLHVHEKWQLQESAKGGMYCAACGDDLPNHPPPKEGTTMSTTLTPGTFTAFPYSSVEAESFEALADDEMGRVLVKPADPSAVTSETWLDTTDELSGRTIQMRRADCGAGCRCATEVRLAPGWGR